ncbi:GNAT family N-acetyltransferase [Allohahella marinimesophila]|uniref:GNAT family N-acetyltransferase n=1 Tax=Allohahella marinimesophila TaxID=1054972 RepID=A0ABP7NZD7_9GAMM
MIIAETDRLLIREFVFDDAERLAPILGDPAVMEYSINGPLSAEATTRFINACTESYSQHGFGQWALVDLDTQALIGFCGLSCVTINQRQDVEIGYRLARSVWGRGLASEAASEVLTYGFGKKALSSIIAIIAPAHTASIRVAEKAGFSDFETTRYRGWDVRMYRQRR